VAHGFRRHEFERFIAAAVLEPTRDRFTPVQFDSGPPGRPDVGDHLDTEQQHRGTLARMDFPREFIDQLLRRLPAQFPVNQLFGTRAHTFRQRPGQVPRPVEGTLAARNRVFEGPNGCNDIDGIHEFPRGGVSQRPSHSLFSQAAIGRGVIQACGDLLHRLSHADQHRQCI
jgi:hypothetical protein